MGIVQVAFLITLLILQFTVFKDGKNSNVRDNVYGVIGAITAFLMYTSTFNQVVSAFTTYDVAGLELAWGFLANAAIWTLYSRLSPMDLFLLIANAIGVASTIFQCGVWLTFRNRQPQSPAATRPSASASML
ncbi:bidirectional sugar transporter SWEET17-like [Lolium perenne]|uniref:bidirectional sugar transporter SWEET17-like n=1 Tax=Lolium perenne TaxID=4522 RepID=UPI0021F64DED|nr:bidirectional sugar transporter SWEET16-like [Lolium perenne]